MNRRNIYQLIENRESFRGSLSRSRLKLRVTNVVRPLEPDTVNTVEGRNNGKAVLLVYSGGAAFLFPALT